MAHRRSPHSPIFVPEYPATGGGVYAHWALDHFTSGADADATKLCATGKTLGSQYEKYTWDPYTDASRKNAAAYETAATFASRRLGWRAEACSSSYR
jgi:hypothetical protein